MLPVKTIKQEETTVKIVVDDFYKSLNRIGDALNKATDKIIDIMDSVHKYYEDYEGELIIGKGVSRPCNGDVYDEKLGEKIAFIKAKINANYKKLNILDQILNALKPLDDTLIAEYYNFISQITQDTEVIKEFNPDFNHR